MDRISFQIQQRLQALPDVGLVVDDENPSSCRLVGAATA
jgi:hypothetical protein